MENSLPGTENFTPENRVLGAKNTGDRELNP